MDDFDYPSDVDIDAALEEENAFGGNAFGGDDFAQNYVNETIPEDLIDDAAAVDGKPSDADTAFDEELAKLTGIASPVRELVETGDAPVAPKRNFQWMPAKATQQILGQQEALELRQTEVARNVLAHRRFLQQAHKHRPDVNATNVAAGTLPTASEGIRYFFDRPPIADYGQTGEEFVQCFEFRLGNGDLCYLGVRDANEVASKSRPIAGRLEMAVGNLLPVPISELQAELDGNTRHSSLSTLQRAQAALDTAAKLLDTDAPYDENDGAVSGPVEPEAAPGEEQLECTPSSALWVDRYAPRSFADLLSPEQVNRNVLKWIKLWDKKVFGTKGTDETSGTKRTFARISGSTFESSAGKRSRTETGAKGNIGPVDTPGAPPDASKKFGFTQMKGVPGAAAESGPRFGPGWRPDAKVLLLCGPPGTGKTTLAHIAAKQAGYRPVEINASDDRSSKTIREKIADAQGMQSVFGEKKPSLIILDEIDGMEGGPHGGIAELVKMIKATPSLIPKRATNSLKDLTGGSSAKDGDDEEEDPMQAAGDDSGSAKRSKSGGKANHASKKPDVASEVDPHNTSQPLSRPLICICNDQYAPALRELRPLVQVVEFSKTAPERLGSRLRAICRAEGLMATQDALQTLVSMTDCDIRGSLNTLQFIKFRGERGKHKGMQPVRVTTDMVSKAAVGIRDQTKALYDVWTNIFKKPDIRLRSTAALQSLGMAGGHSKPHGTEAHMSTAVISASQQYINEIAASVGAYGSDARLFLTGLFENIPAARASDPTMTKTWQSLDLICYGEELCHKVQTTQMYSLMKYLPLVATGTHLYLASDLTTKISWPKSDAAFRSAQEHRRNIINSFLSGRVGGISLACGALDTRTTVLDILSPLLTIASPPLRPVNFGLMNTREKRDAQELVQVMASMGLTYIAKSQNFKNKFRYRQNVTEDTTYVLQPEIHTLVEYSGYNAWDGELRSSLPEILKHLLAHEVRQARIRALHRKDEVHTAPEQPAMSAHLKKHLQTMPGGQAAPEPAETVAVKPFEPVADIELTQISAKALAATSFLVHAARISQAAEIARKRSYIAVAEASKKSGSGPHTAANTRGKYPVVYKYQEGFTNAVRRPVRMADFM